MKLGLPARNPKPTPPPPPLSASLWLLATAAVTLGPHAVTHLPAWLSAACVLALIWRAWALRTGAPRSHALLVMLLACVAALAIRLHYGHFFGKDPGVALLALLLCLKQHEIASSRDIRAAVLLAFFLQLGLFFYDQSLPVAALALTGTLLATVSLLALQTDRFRPTASLRLGGLMLVQAIPFLLVLFVLFPRIPGPLWGLPADAHSGMTGLSDNMSPGSISQLGLSEAIAFRAEFSGTPPSPPQRYWRGPVLTDFDGRTWRAATVGSDAQPSVVVAGPAHSYRLTIEPHNQRWLLALEHPVSTDATVRFARDQQLLATTPLRSRTRIEIVSHPEAVAGLNESRAVLERALRLPSGSNPRAVATGAEIGRNSATPAATLQAVLDHIASLGLTYTLRPPLLGENTVDEFLYTTQLGFCEHFASSFTVLARAAGLPARVVTGYQGGEINPVDGVMVVRQSDAHAWAEVWLPERGWQRVDPTALAAPSRIESGLAASLPSGDPLPLFSRPAMSWLRDMRHRWEALSNAWNQTVIGFSAGDQRRLLERLGFAEPDWKALTGLLGSLSVALMLGLFAWAMRQRARRDPLDGAWQAFCNKFARKGCPRLPWEGPMDYAERLAEHYPRQAPMLRAIARTYARLRYGRASSRHDAEIRELRTRVRQLRID